MGHRVEKMLISVDNQEAATTGYQVFHRFVVTQGERSMPASRSSGVLRCGRLYPSAHDNHGRPAASHVGRREDLLERMIPFFRSIRSDREARRLREVRRCSSRSVGPAPDDEV